MRILKDVHYFYYSIIFVREVVPFSCVATAAAVGAGAAGAPLGSFLFRKQLIWIGVDG